MALKDLRKRLEGKLNNSNVDESLQQSFIEEYNDTAKRLEKMCRQEVPTDTYRPSQLSGGCKRMLYYQRTGVKAVEERDVNLIEICDNGTDRHERIQHIVKNMDGVTYLDVEEVLEEAKCEGINTEFVKWNEDKTEVRLLNKNYGLYFQPDGLIRYKGKELILELKTINSFSFNKLEKPKDEHLEQVTCYSIGTGIRTVLFVYEERNFLNKKLFLITVTDEMRQKIIDKIDTVNRYVAEGKLPKREIDKCQYCNFKAKCKEDLKNGTE